MPLEYFKDDQGTECPNTNVALRSSQFWILLSMLSISTSTSLLTSSCRILIQHGL
jgi:hypothetical protein